MDRWQQINQLFHSALAHERNQRAAFLVQACAGDEALRAEVESLVASHEQAESFIEQPASDVAAELLAGAHSQLSAGQQLGHYTITSLLGAGGMGEVYLAEDLLLGRRIALKLLPAHFTVDGERVRRFEQEARAASGLNHPNIVTIHEIGRADSAHFIATEFIDGETLRASLSRSRLSLRAALDVAIQVASALVAAHKAGIVHRDIKPENIMVRRDDRVVKVLDFGLAKLLETHAQQRADSAAPTRALVKTGAGVVMGTVSYMSPEQARGLAVDERTDIWSLGVVLYEMVAGHLPFAGETASDCVAAILKTEPPLLTRHAPDVPAELERIVEKALRKDREERYQSSKELALDLKSLKQRVEFEAELERTGTLGRSEAARRVATGEPSAEIVTAPVAAAQTGGASSDIHTTSSAEYIMSEINRHKRGFVVALVVLLVAGIGLGYWFSANRPANKIPIESIAVLPLENLSGAASQDYFADGMTDAVITELAKMGNLRVISRNSTIQYKGTRKQITEIASELNVDAVVVGTVLRAGDKVRISTQMFRASDDQNIWSNSYERDIRDVLALQSEVSRGIVSEIKVKLTPQEQAGLTSKSAIKPEANDALFRGHYYFYQAINNATSSDEIKALHEKSFDYYQQAIAIEPNYAEAYAALATSYHWLASAGINSDEYFPKSIAAANKAIQIDETNARAHTALAYCAWNYNWDAVTAEKEYKRAIELDSNRGHGGYALLLSSLGHHDEAIREMKLAKSADPLNLYLKYLVAIIYVNARQYDKAIEQCRYVITLNPTQPDFQIGLVLSLTYKGRYQEALAETQKFLEMTKTPPASSLRLAWVYAMAGQREEAIKILNEHRKQPEEKQELVLIAEIYAALGDKDQAIFWLEKSIPLRQPRLQWLKVDPAFDKIRDDPRFQDLLRRRVGLSQ